MIPVNDAQLYAAALIQLKSHVPAKGFRGKVVQLFLGIKRYPADFPTIGASIGVTTGRVELLLDELYSKSMRPASSRIASIFSNSHLSTTANVWRNSLGLQKPAKCYATDLEILDPVFRMAPRLNCPHLVPAPSKQGTLEDAGCDLYAKARYRGEDGIKMLRQDPLSREFFVYDPTDHGYYVDLVVPANGERIPIAALIPALYFDSTVANGRTHVDLTDFMADFHMVADELTAYFDDDPASPANQPIVTAFAFSWTRAANTGPLIIPPSATVGPVVIVPATPNPSSAPAISNWWSAERAVQSELEAMNWQVTDHSTGGLGYDLFAKKQTRTIYVEVKSSVGACSVVLTDNEMRAARLHKSDYVLAVLDNFTPGLPPSIKWIWNPASIPSVPRTTTNHYFGRTGLMSASTATTP